MLLRKPVKINIEPVQAAGGNSHTGVVCVVRKYSMPDYPLEIVVETMHGRRASAHNHKLVCTSLHSAVILIDPEGDKNIFFFLYV